MLHSFYRSIPTSSSPRDAQLAGRRPVVLKFMEHDPHPRDGWSARPLIWLDGEGTQVRLSIRLLALFKE